MVQFGGYDVPVRDGLPSIGVSPTAQQLSNQARTGWWLTPTGNSTAGAVTLNRVYFVPFLLSNPLTIDQIGFEVTTGGSAGSILRAGVYGAGEDGLPGDLLFADPSTVDGTSIAEKTVNASVVLPPGRIYLAVVAQVAAPTMRVTNSNSNASHIISPTLTIAMQTAGGVYFQDAVTGALPATAVVGGSTTTYPRVAARVLA